MATVKNVSLRTPRRPKYSLIKSVDTKTTGQGMMPTDIAKGPSGPSRQDSSPTEMIFPPISSATTAFVRKKPPRTVKTMSFRVMTSALYHLHPPHAGEKNVKGGAPQKQNLAPVGRAERPGKKAPVYKENLDSSDPQDEVGNVSADAG